MDPFLLLLAAPLAMGIYLIAATREHSRWRAARTLIGAFLVALPVGGLGYFFSGIWVARARGIGHFFSVPFGGYAVTDDAIFLSLMCWIGLVFVPVGLAFRKRLTRLP
jgi:hypothetical protein